MSQDNNSPEKFKFCRDCKHLLGKRSDLDAARDERWKCYHPTNIQEQGYNLVTGERITSVLYSINKLRQEDRACGRDGNWFELYVPPSYISSTTASVPSPAPATPKLKLNAGKITLMDL